MPVFQLSVETSRPDSSRWPFPEFSDVRFDHKRSRLPSVLCESAIPFCCSCLTQFTHSRSLPRLRNALACVDTLLSQRVVVSARSCPLTGRQAPLQPSSESSKPFLFEILIAFRVRSVFVLLHPRSAEGCALQGMAQYRGARGGEATCGTLTDCIAWRWAPGTSVCAAVLL